MYFPYCSIRLLSSIIHKELLLYKIFCSRIAFEKGVKMAKASRKLPGGATPAQLKKIMTRASVLRKSGSKPGPALRRAWADFKSGKL